MLGVMEMNLGVPGIYVSARVNEQLDKLQSFRSPRPGGSESTRHRLGHLYLCPYLPVA